MKGGIAYGSPSNENAEAILEKLRKNLASRGVNGIIGIGKVFRIADDDNSGALNAEEFKKSMREHKVNIPDDQL